MSKKGGTIVPFSFLSFFSIMIHTIASSYFLAEHIAFNLLHWPEDCDCQFIANLAAVVRENGAVAALQWERERGL